VEPAYGTERNGNAAGLQGEPCATGQALRLFKIFCPPLGTSAWRQWSLLAGRKEMEEPQGYNWNPALQQCRVGRARLAVDRKIFFIDLLAANLFRVCRMCIICGSRFWPFGLRRSPLSRLFTPFMPGAPQYIFNSLDNNSCVLYDVSLMCVRGPSRSRRVRSKLETRNSKPAPVGIYGISGGTK